MLKKKMITWFAAAMVSVAAHAAAQAPKGRLVSPEWLQKNHGNVVLLDTSAAQVYQKEHIPGAMNVDLFVYGAREIPTPEMEKILQGFGISLGKPVVVYDQGAGIMATRTFWTLEYFGFPTKDIYLLDGGLAKWKQSGLPVTKEPTPAPQKGTFRIVKANENVRVRLPEVLDATADTQKFALVEALGPNWHFGEVAPFDRPGHIPNGIMLPPTDFYNPDNTFKSPAEIQKMLDHLGIRRDQEIYTYCGGGIASSVPYFALKYLANYPKVRMYKESELGWLQDERRLPYWTYDAPALMRDSDWVRAWGGRMMRMYAVSNVSVLDVRPAAEYDASHIAFSVNVPADLIRATLADPDRLAAVLGPLGVNPDQEAVVASGAGLTKEAALGYLALEHLGQKKVAILTDSFDTAKSRGVQLTKEPTAIGPSKGFGDVTIAPTTYTPRPRRNVITAADAPAGLFPRVYVASGKAAPSKALDGKVAHVPYTELINPDGTPKAAKDIWNILAKAGITRYAELVCVSDDPAEAAVNYYILRLMGFPDVKVLAN